MTHVDRYLASVSAIEVFGGAELAVISVFLQV
jgi:hypothetical protein